MQLSFPLISFIRRPDNGHYFNKRNQDVTENFLNALTGGKIAPLWDAFMFTGKVGYKHKLNEHWHIEGNYYFNYSSAKEPHPLKMFMNNFSAGGSYTF